jgi:hypothetical protein
MDRDQVFQYLIAEYQACWDLVKINNEIYYRWTRFYWIIIGAGFVVIYTIVTKPLRPVNELFLISTFILFAVGLLIFILLTYSRMRSTEYLNAANAVRSVYRKLAETEDLQTAIALPVEPQRFVKFSGVYFVSAMFVAFFNSFFAYLAFILRFDDCMNRLVLRENTIISFGPVTAFVISVLVHALLWSLMLFSKQRQNKQ